MNFLFLMDPLETVIVGKDTSFLLMLGAHRRGHRIYYLPNGGMALKKGKLQFHVTEVIPRKVAGKAAVCPFIIKKQKTLSENDADVIFVRSDLLRAVVVPIHREVSAAVIRDNLKTLGISSERYLDIIKNL